MASNKLVGECPPNRAERRHPEQHRPPLDVPGAAEYLGVKERYIRRLIQERRIQHFKLGAKEGRGGKIRFSPEDLDRFMDDSRVEAKS